MSTKILNAYRLPEGVTAFEFVNTIRPILDAEADRVDATTMVREAIHHYDSRVHDKAPSHTPLIAAASEMLDKDTTKHKDPGHPGAFSLGLAEHDGRLYARAEADSNELLHAFNQIDGVEDFHYQNSGDRPADVTEEEWDHRADVWDHILDRWRPPIERMLWFTLRGAYHGGILNLLHNHDGTLFDKAWNSPDVTHRAKPNTRAAILVRTRAANSDIAARGVATSTNHVIRAIHRYAGDNDLTPIIEYAERLFPDLTPIDLTRPTPALTESQRRALDKVKALTDEHVVARIRRP